MAEAVPAPAAPPAGPTAGLPPTPSSGLTDAEAARRRAAGLGNTAPPATTRTYAQIVRENVFTFINNVIFVLGVAARARRAGRSTPSSRSASSSTNIVVSVVQEVRAKRTLDRIALLTRPTATLVREGAERAVPPEDLVVGDLLRVGAGDQVVLDGRLADGSLEADESQLTGESDLVPKRPGDPVYSGSFVVNGGGSFVVDRGRQRQPGEPDHGRRAHLPPGPHPAPERDQPRDPGRARGRRLPRDRAAPQQRPQARRGRADGRRGGAPRRARPERPLRLDRHRLRPGRGADRPLRGAGPAGERDRVAEQRRRPVPGQDRHAHREPAVGRRGRRRSAGSEEDLRATLGARGRQRRRPQQDRRGDRRRLPGRRRCRSPPTCPFSSARKWSAVAFAARPRSARTARRSAGPGAAGPRASSPWAPPSSCARPWRAWTTTTPVPAGARCAAHRRLHWPQGLRVLAGRPAHPDAGRARPARTTRRTLPAGMRALGLVVLRDELRPDAAATLARFTAAGVTPKVISGDDPETVAALARQAGLGPEIRFVSGPELDALDDATLAAVAERDDRLRADHAGPEGAPGRRAARPRPLRRDDRRRRERRPLAQEGEPGDRDAERQPGGARRGRHRPDRTTRSRRSRRPSRRASGSSTGCRTSCGSS